MPAKARAALEAIRPRRSRNMGDSGYVGGRHAGERSWFDDGRRGKRL
jgi:hypothetical protein